MAGSGGNFRGLFCVFLLLILVAILAVASLVLQIFTWTLVMDDEEDSSNASGTRRGRGGEPEVVREIRQNLAMFQLDNGAGPPIKNIIEYNRGDYRDDRVWTLGMGYVFDNNLAHYDEETGKAYGYHIDVVNAVCRVAGKNCRLVQGRGCWETDPDFGARGGPGLHSRWFDACVGLSPTFIRNLVFDFTESISRPPNIYFYTLPGNTRNFNWRDLRGRNIGLLTGWYTDVDCIARNEDKIQGADLDANQFTYFSNNEELYDALQSGQVDATLLADEVESLTNRLEVVSDRITNCALDGDGVMIRKDSKLREWFDPALRTVLNSREYREICSDIDNFYNTFLPGRSADTICRSQY